MYSTDKFEILISFLYIVPNEQMLREVNGLKKKKKKKNQPCVRTS